ncbi:hypothetical protein GCM10010517_73800 [Streptosporangium fragile]|uniref:RDD domain-containing protein n=1 Tax=Streptosporangium fragile TaxID=46186 RepID=A0ABN3W9W5_9ACTN
MGRRLGAWVVDLIALFVIMLLVALLYTRFTYATGPGAGPHLLDDLILRLIGIVIVVLYEPVMTGLYGGTFGKIVVGIRVVHVDTGEPVMMGASFVRYICIVVIGFVTSLLPQAAGSILWLLWALSAFFDRSGYRQAWHDKVAKTWVVDR